MSDPNNPIPVQPNQPFLYPHQMAPPREKKKMGCVAWGCIILGILGVLGALVFGGAIYVGIQMISNIATGKSEETPVYEGTDAERSALQAKLTRLKTSFDNYTLDSENFNEQELNILISRFPELKKRLYVTISDGVVHAQAVVPLGLISSYFGNSTISLQIDSIPTIADGKVDLQLKAIKYGDHQLDSATVSTIEDKVNDGLNKHIHDDDDLRATIKHIKAVNVDGKQISITTQ